MGNAFLLRTQCMGWVRDEMDPMDPSLNKMFPSNGDARCDGMAWIGWWWWIACWQLGIRIGPVRCDEWDVKREKFQHFISYARKYRIILSSSWRPGSIWESPRLFFMVSALIFNCCLLNTSSEWRWRWRPGATTRVAGKVAQIYLERSTPEPCRHSLSTLWPSACSRIQ